VDNLRASRSLLAAELSQSSWADFGAFKWRDIALGPAARATVGVIVPLVIGVATGNVTYGSYAALGALPAGVVTFQGVTRTRVAAVVMASAGMAVSTFVGATASAVGWWLLVPVIFVWAYVVGLLAALGPTVLTIALQQPLALLIASAIPLGPGPAALRACLVLAGGLWQSALVVSSWTVNRGGSERAAMGQSLHGVSGYAASLAVGRLEAPSPAMLAASRALRDPNPLLRSAARVRLLALADEVERLRATMTALGVGRPAAGIEPAGRELLTGAAAVLSELAAAVTSRPALRAGHLAAAKKQVAATSAESDTAWQWAGEALLGQLRAACQLVEQLNEAEPGQSPQIRTSMAERATVREVALTLRASLGTSSEAGRHALRLAVTAALAELIVRASGLGHGYWAVLTVCIVLRPDYSATLHRGLQRAAGTLVGAGLGVCTVLLGKVSVTALLGGVAASLLCAYALFPVNYLVYAVFLTDFVVVLLALLGLPADSTAITRVIGTGVGTALAVLGYVLWPTWEGTSAAEKLARTFAAQGGYARETLRAYTRPGSGWTRRRSEMEIAARRYRIDSEASADRLAGEPDHPPMTAALAESLTAAARRVAQALLALAAAAVAHEYSPDEAEDALLQPRLDAFADGVAEGADQLARRLRELSDSGALPASGPEPEQPGPGQPEPEQPGPGQLVPESAAMPPLRTLQRAIWPDGADVAGDAEGSPTEAGLFAATDSLVDAINTAAHVLARG
jgi:uncharacterized membrane protein YccC